MRTRTSPGRTGPSSTSLDRKRPGFGVRERPSAVAQHSRSHLHERTAVHRVSSARAHLRRQRRGTAGGAIHEYVDKPALGGGLELTFTKEADAVSDAGRAQAIHAQSRFDGLRKGELGEESAMRFGTHSDRCTGNACPALREQSDRN